MTRYFYTDPLAAAWQAKHFGMLTTLGALASEYEEAILVAPITAQTVPLHDLLLEDALSARMADERYYVHPDSLHLLEPRVDDIVIVLPHLTEEFPPNDPCRHKLKHVGWVNESPWVSPSGQICAGIAKVDDTPDSWLGLVREHRYLEVVQRDGKPFHWPERE